VLALSRVFGLVALMSVGVVAAAHAQAPDASRDAEARGLFEAGRAAFNDGRFEDALGYFRRAYELSGRADLLYNIGNTADRLRREGEALDAFEQYLREVPSSPNRREVEGRVRVMREHLGSQTEPPLASDIGEPEYEDATTAPVVDPLMEQREDQQPSGGGIETQWWFWTIIGAVVAGGIVTAVVLATTSQPTILYEPYVVGDNGAIAFALTVPMP
jgi:tetratricopeptide (TPR) repeat protein